MKKQKYFKNNKPSTIIRTAASVLVCVVFVALLVVNGANIVLSQRKVPGIPNANSMIIQSLPGGDKANRTTDDALTETCESTPSDEVETAGEETLGTVVDPPSSESTVEPKTEPVKTTVRPAATKPAATNPPATKPPVTSPPVTSPPTTKPNAPNVVTIPLKYGVNQVETTEVFYDAANGGNRNLITVTFDRTGYHATTGELMGEATENYNRYQAEINTILKNANRYRADAGAAPVTLDVALSKAAMVRACEMAWSGKHSHTRPNGAKFSTVLNETGITWSGCGENIAMGYPDAQTVSEVWKNSPDHNKTMLNPKYSKIGIGVAVDERGCYYWCQEYIY